MGTINKELLTNEWREFLEETGLELNEKTYQAMLRLGKRFSYKWDTSKWHGDDFFRPQPL